MNPSKKVFGILFLSEILSLFGTICTIAGGILLIAMAMDQAEAGVVIGAIITYASLAITIIGGILSIVAYVKGRKLNPNFFAAFILVVVNLALRAINVFMPEFFVQNSFLGVCAVAFESIVSLCISICVISAAQQIASQENRTELAHKASRVLFAYTIIGLISVCSNILSAILSLNVIIALVASIAYLVFLIISYILYLSLLRRCSKEL